jgi:KipI family sensor histidine kinase inhibitor
MSKSLQINGTSWKVSELGEQVLELKSIKENPLISDTIKAAKILEAADLNGVTDIIQSYESIAVCYDRLLEDLEAEVKAIEEACTGITIQESSARTHEIPVCYHLGLDWNDVENYTGLSRKDVVQIHSSASYTVAMQGFVPGFIYLSGLPEKISCPRKTEPRTKIPAGAIGIGGNQTGLYSLESPGGWQIIGQTPFSFFDTSKNPPTEIQSGDKVVFREISEEEFKKLREENDRES